jgi:hypothetical protein
LPRTAGLNTSRCTPTVHRISMRPTMTEPKQKVVRALSSQFTIGAQEEAQFAQESTLGPQERTPNPHPAAQVHIAPVHTLVCTGKGTFPGTNYAVPTFAVHWGVIVRGVLFHLKYNGRKKEISFQIQLWESTTSYQVDKVGHTTYVTDDIIKIGAMSSLKCLIFKRQKVDRCIWRLSSTILELSNICQGLPSSHLRSTQRRFRPLDFF